MGSAENRPPGFENYTPRESRDGSYLNLTEPQRDELDGLILQSAANWPDQDPCKIIQEATGIAHLAIATGLVSLVQDKTLIRGGEVLLKVNLKC